MIKIVKTVNDVVLQGRGQRDLCHVYPRAPGPRASRRLRRLAHLPNRSPRWRPQAARAPRRVRQGHKAPRPVCRGQGRASAGRTRGCGSVRPRSGHSQRAYRRRARQVSRRHRGARGGHQASSGSRLSGTVTNRAGQDLAFPPSKRRATSIARRPGPADRPTTRAFDEPRDGCRRGSTVSNLGDFRLQEAMRIRISAGRSQSMIGTRASVGARPPQVEGKTVVAMTGDLSASVRRDARLRHGHRPFLPANRRHQDTGRQSARADRLQRLSRRGRREASIHDQACDLGSPRQLQRSSDVKPNPQSPTHGLRNRCRRGMKNRRPQC